MAPTTTGSKTGVKTSTKAGIKTDATPTGRPAAAKKTSARKAQAAKLVPISSGPVSGPLAGAMKDKPRGSVAPPQTLAAGQEPSPVVVSSAPKERAAQEAAAGDPVVKDPPLNKRELIDAAVLRSGIKKKDAKPVVEALLAILGETVAAGRDLNLKPFGKLHVNRSDQRNNGTVHVCRLRQPLEQNSMGQETEQLADISGGSPLAQDER